MQTSSCFFQLGKPFHVFLLGFLIFMFFLILVSFFFRLFVFVSRLANSSSHEQSCSTTFTDLHRLALTATLAEGSTFLSFHKLQKRLLKRGDVFSFELIPYIRAVAG